MVLVPVFNEAESLPELTERTFQAFKSIDSEAHFKILFVDDGSTDETRDVIAKLEAAHEYVTSLRFRRNYGKSLALMAGFRANEADFVITLDGDLQDNPEDIPHLIEHISKGADLVSGWRQKRQDQKVRKIGSKVFNAVVKKTTGLALHDINCGFKVYRKDVVDLLAVYGQYHRYIPVLAHLLGFKVDEAEVQNSARKYGVSKFATFRYQGVFDLMSILFIYRYGLNPLHFFGVVSLCLIIPGVLVLLYLFILHAMFWLGLGDEFMLPNRPLLSIALNTTLMGIGVFLAGFVCDFLLHHQVRKNLSWIIDAAVEPKSPRSKP